MEVLIKTQWNGKAIDHDPVHFKLEINSDGLVVYVEAPFFNDPSPDGKPGEAMWLLWEYEVVELFFLDSHTGEYLELEFGPHGQHLALIFKECRKPLKKCLPLEYSTSVSEQKWSGKSVIPWDYFPANTNKFNAFAMHGAESRVYEALFPVPEDLFQEPDFHRLEYFSEIPVHSFIPKQDRQKNSIWLCP